MRNVLYNINVNIFVLYNESMNTEQHLFEIEIFCSIIPVFAVTFDQFHSFLLNKKGKKEGEIYLKPVFSSFKKRKSEVAVLKWHMPVWMSSAEFEFLYFCTSAHAGHMSTYCIRNTEHSDILFMWHIDLCSILRCWFYSCNSIPAVLIIATWHT